MGGVGKTGAIGAGGEASTSSEKVDDLIKQSPAPGGGDTKLPKEVLVLGGKTIHQLADKLTDPKSYKGIKDCPELRALEAQLAQAHKRLIRVEDGGLFGEIAKLSDQLFGELGLIKGSCGKELLLDKVVELAHKKNIPLALFEPVLDEIRVNAKQYALPVPDVLKALKGIHEACQSFEGKTYLTKDFSERVESERGKLSLKLAKSLKSLNRDLKLNEFRSSNAIIKEIKQFLIEKKVDQNDIFRVCKFVKDNYSLDKPDLERLTALNDAVEQVNQLINLHRFDSIARVVSTIHRGPLVGKGGIGEVYEVVCEGKTKLLKEFQHGLGFPIALDLSDPMDPKLLRTNELTAAFLKPHELEVINAPTHFLVSESQAGKPDITYLVEVADKEFRAWAKDKLLKNKDNVGYGLSIKGSLQNYAKGKELSSYLSSESADKVSANAEAIVKDSVRALIVLCNRGFVHGDLKPSNTFFDSSTGKVSLIDTGGLVKISKQQPRQNATAFDYKRTITPSFAFPNLFRKKKAGFEQDLYSTGLQILEVLSKTDFPNAKKCDDLRKGMKKEMEDFFSSNRKAKTDPSVIAKPLGEVESAYFGDALEGVRKIASLPGPLPKHQELELIGLLAIALPFTKVNQYSRDEQLKTLGALVNDPLSFAKACL